MRKPCDVDRANEVASAVVDAIVRVHRELGPGLLERAYVVALAWELRARGLLVAQEVPVRLTYRGHDMGLAAFRADLVVEGCVVVEAKAISNVLPVHLAQLVTYLKVGDYPVGILINFHETLAKDGLHRRVHPSLRGVMGMS